MLNGCIRSLQYNIKGSVATLRAMTTPFYWTIINFCVFWALGFIASPQKVSFQNTVKPLNNMHADMHIGGRVFVSSRKVVRPIQKLISRGGICLFSEVILYTTMANLSATG